MPGKPTPGRCKHCQATKSFDPWNEAGTLHLRSGGRYANPEEPREPAFQMTRWSPKPQSEAS